MKTQIKLAVALFASCLAAPFQRGRDTVALANDNQPKPGESKNNPGQQASQSELVKENDELRKKVATLEAAQPMNSKAIKERMAAGLSREQAEAVVARQEKFAEQFRKAGIGQNKGAKK